MPRRKRGKEGRRERARERERARLDGGAGVADVGAEKRTKATGVRSGRWESVPSELRALGLGGALALLLREDEYDIAAELAAWVAAKLREAGVGPSADSPSAVLAAWQQVDDVSLVLRLERDAELWAAERKGAASGGDDAVEPLRIHELDQGTAEERDGPRLRAAWDTACSHAVTWRPVWESVPTLLRTAGVPGTLRALCRRRERAPLEVARALARYLAGHAAMQRVVGAQPTLQDVIDEAARLDHDDPPAGRHLALDLGSYAQDVKVYVRALDEGSHG